MKSNIDRTSVAVRAGSSLTVHPYEQGFLFVSIRTDPAGTALHAQGQQTSCVSERDVVLENRVSLRSSSEPTGWDGEPGPEYQIGVEVEGLA